MTLDERAEKIARECIQTHCTPFHVSATQFQTEKVIAAAKAQIILELKAFAAELCIKLE